MKCPYCGYDLPDNAVYCVNCRSDLSSQIKREKRKTVFIGFILLVLLFLALEKILISCMTQNLPGKPTNTPTITPTATANSETLMAVAVKTAEYLYQLTGTPTPTYTPEPTYTPTFIPTATITLATTGLSDDLCLNHQVAINMKADILNAQGDMVGPTFDYETNTCSYKFKEGGIFGEIIGYATLALSIEEQEPGIAVLTWYFKDTPERAEQILDWSAAYLAHINPYTNVLSASDVIAESLENSIATSDRYSVYTQYDLSNMTVNIMIGDVNEIVK